jgi:tRNA threonylcarbamoyladenosine modification (KEOPS) complex  Pcc1 subunit
MTFSSLTEETYAEVFIELPEAYIQVVLEALKPETDVPSSERSRVEVKRENGGVRIISYSSDTSALRASLNSYLRWIQGILETLRSVE